MKTILLFLAMMGGTGYLFRDQLQSLVHPRQQAVVPQANPDRVGGDRFHRTEFEASAARREGPGSTAQAPILYNVERREIVERRSEPVVHREILMREHERRFNETRSTRATPPPLLPRSR